MITITAIITIISIITITIKWTMQALNSDGELGRDGTSKLQCAGILSSSSSSVISSSSSVLSSSSSSVLGSSMSVFSLSSSLPSS